MDMICSLTWAKVDMLNTDSIGSEISDYRQKKLERIKHLPTKQQSLGAELLLIEALRERGTKPPLRLETLSHGKPILPGSPWHFSLSHTGAFSACLLADVPVGLDIQSVSPPHEGVLRRCFTERETALIYSAVEPERCFTQLWSRKESLSKLLGDGLLLPLIELDCADTLVKYRGESYCFYDWETPAFLGAVCLSVKDAELRFPPLIRQVRLPS